MGLFKKKRTTTEHDIDIKTLINQFGVDHPDKMTNIVDCWVHSKLYDDYCKKNNIKKLEEPIDPNELIRQCIYDFGVNYPGDMTIMAEDWLKSKNYDEYCKNTGFPKSVLYVKDEDQLCIANDKYAHMSFEDLINNVNFIPRHNVVMLVEDNCIKLSNEFVKCMLTAMYRLRNAEYVETMRDMFVFRNEYDESNNTPEVSDSSIKQTRIPFLNQLDHIDEYIDLSIGLTKDGLIAVQPEFGTFCDNEPFKMRITNGSGIISGDEFKRLKWSFLSQELTPGIYIGRPMYSLFLFKLAKNGEASYVV